MKRKEDKSFKNSIKTTIINLISKLSEKVIII